MPYLPYEQNIYMMQASGNEDACVYFSGKDDP